MTNRNHPQPVTMEHHKTKEEEKKNRKEFNL